MITLKKFSIYLDDLKVIHDFNFSFKSNLMHIFGSNGSGKTILLEAMLGLIQFEGKLFFKSQPIESLFAIEKNIIYIGHISSMYDDLTVNDALNMWFILYNTPNTPNENINNEKNFNKSQNLIHQSMNYWNLNSILGTKIKNLSTGTIKKVELAKLLICKSNFWVLDEPYTNLDNLAKLKLNNLIKYKLKKNGYIVLTTHEDYNFNFYNSEKLDSFKLN